MKTNEEPQSETPANDAEERLEVAVIESHSPPKKKQTRAEKKARLKAEKEAARKGKKKIVTTKAFGAE